MPFWSPAAPGSSAFMWPGPSYPMAPEWWVWIISVITTTRRSSTPGTGNCANTPILSRSPGIWRTCRPWRRSLPGIGPPKICHLAAQAGVRYSLINPFAYQKANLEGFLNLLELERVSGGAHILYASSSSVYGGLKAILFGSPLFIAPPVAWGCHWHPSTSDCRLRPCRLKCAALSPVSKAPKRRGC